MLKFTMDDHKSVPCPRTHEAPSRTWPQPTGGESSSSNGNFNLVQPRALPACGCDEMYILNQG